ncbi:RNA polymerase sigma factor [Adlercreutzia sp. ZJ242]|uniref:RNA polymerase sigma factor n=1 Tax=Adlercreutzia sp. ZJ242 TaxID=2709409 RepID=UPI0013EAC4C7|nr:sigma-70 family RNA polymerase sigma factor [Adlercreutzia sp. ZJ242]
MPTAEDAKDAAQEVFLRLAKSRALYDSREKPLAYLYTCARNVCIDIARRARPVSSFGEADAETISDPAQEHFQQDLLLADALSRLPAEEREVLELRYGQDLKVADVAAILSKSRFALYRIEQRALSNLKKMMGDDTD